MNRELDSPVESQPLKTDPSEKFEPLLDCRQAALHVHCHEKTLQRYARRGLIPAYNIHHRWYFRASELDSWVRSQVHSPCYPCRTN